MHMSLKSKAHDEKEKEIEAVHRVSMDYFYMSQAGEDANENPCLVVVDEETGERYARAIGRKGVGEDGEMDWLAKDAAGELKVWGHTGGMNSSLMLKCDGEESLIVHRFLVLIKRE